MLFLVCYWLFAAYLSFRMERVLSAPATKLLQFYLPLYLFFVLAGVIVAAIANRTLQRNKVVGIFYLCHCRVCENFRFPDEEN